MKRKKTVVNWVLGTGILTLLIGIMHTVSAPMIFKAQVGKFPLLPREFLLKNVYFFAAMGSTVIFLGLLLIWTARHLRKEKSWAWLLSLASSCFLVLLMANAIYFKMNNLLILLLLVGNSVNVFFLLFSRKEFTQQ